MSLLCANSFCESQTSYIIYGVIEVLIAGGLIFCYICLPLVLGIIYFCRSRKKKVSYYDKNNQALETKPETQLEEVQPSSGYTKQKDKK